jgi:hypothetical protein
MRRNRCTYYELARPLPGVGGKKLGCPLGWAISVVSRPVTVNIQCLKLFSIIIYVIILVEVNKSYLNVAILEYD